MSHFLKFDSKYDPYDIFEIDDIKEMYKVDDNNVKTYLNLYEVYGNYMIDGVKRVLVLPKSVIKKYLIDIDDNSLLDLINKPSPYITVDPFSSSSHKFYIKGDIPCAYGGNDIVNVKGYYGGKEDEIVEIRIRYDEFRKRLRSE